MKNNKIIILAIESSCDDTSVAVLKDNEVLSNIVSNQDVHAFYGGVVPELASREHQKNIVPTVDMAIRKANICKKEINAIAFTKGPGLLGSLIVGSSFAKSLALALNIPLISVDHMKGHILAHFIKNNEYTPPKFPFICLTVSGGHTQLVKVSSPYDMEIIGQTLDDAAGEAFDKSAKILGLEYPGGPLIDKYAKKGNNLAYKFGKPKVKDLDFSFSGLKTSILYRIKKEVELEDNFIENNLNDICASIQYSIVNILIDKVEKAIIQTGINEIAIAGGVSANSYLRSRFKILANEKKIKLHIPKFEYCTDNAAMIGIQGYFKYLKEDFSSQNETPSASLRF